MSDQVLKAFEEAFGVWTTTGYFKHKPTQHQLDGFRKGYAIAEQASAARIAQLEQELAEAKKDTDRLKFVLLNTAFTVRVIDNGQPFENWQLMTQDEDENYIALSGEDKYFSSERDAIDAAIKEQQ